MVKKKGGNHSLQSTPVHEQIRSNLSETVAALKADLSKSVKDEKSQKNWLRQQFDLFWAQYKNKYKQYGDIADVVFSHFITYGFTEPEKFEEGLRHFGFPL